MLRSIFCLLGTWRKAMGGVGEVFETLIYVNVFTHAANVY